MTNRRVSWFLVLPAFLGTSACVAQEVGNADAGEALVRQWCSACHVVDERGSGADAGPALPTLLGQDLRTPDEIRGWLADPHPPMPNLDLTRQEIEDVVAYLERLRDESPPSAQ